MSEAKEAFLLEGPCCNGDITILAAQPSERTRWYTTTAIQLLISMIYYVMLHKGYTFTTHIIKQESFLLTC